MAGARYHQRMSAAGVRDREGTGEGGEAGTMQVRG